MASGGRVLIVSPKPPEMAVPPVVKTWNNVQGYMRVRDHSRFPSLSETNLVMLDGDYAEVEGGAAMPPLTFVPPSMFGPPEFIHLDQQDTAKPGVVETAGGRVVWFPWNVAGLYYRRSLPAHAAVVRDALNRLLPDRQLRTDAHPLIEMTVMHQGMRTLLHVVNLTGHSQTAYFEPVPVRDVHVELAGRFTRGRAVRSGAALPVHTEGGVTRIVLPAVRDYELVVLD